MQANPRKTKEKSLDFVGFLWWNWGFSIGYDRKNKKILSILTRVPGCVRKPSRLVHPPVLALPIRSGQRKKLYHKFWILKSNCMRKIAPATAGRGARPSPHSRVRRRGQPDARRCWLAVKRGAIHAEQYARPRDADEEGRASPPLASCYFCSRPSIPMARKLAYLLPTSA